MSSESPAAWRRRSAQESSRGGGRKRIRLTSIAVPPPRRSAVWKPSAPSSPASSARRSSLSGGEILLARPARARSRAGSGGAGGAAPRPSARTARARAARRPSAASTTVSRFSRRLATAALQQLLRARLRSPPRRRGRRAAPRTLPSESSDGAVLDQPVQEGSRSDGDAQTTISRLPGRVAQAVGGREHAAVDGQVGGPRRGAVAARAIRGPAGPLVLSDLHAAPWGSCSPYPHHASTGPRTPSPLAGALRRGPRGGDQGELGGLSSRLMRASSRIAALRSGIGSAIASSTGRRLAV